MTFKVGDRVCTKTKEPQYDGLVGEVMGTASNGDFIVTVSKYPGYTSTLPFKEYELYLEPVVAKQSSYYDFPGGVEVRQISAHLTGFGAQALQYVARATRLDGKNKGDVISDLTKAIDFIRWEIERIEGGNNGD